MSEAETRACLERVMKLADVAGRVIGAETLGQLPAGTAAERIEAALAVLEGRAVTFLATSAN